MKAVVYRRRGDPEVLEYADVPDPKLSQNSVPVRVRAAAPIRRSITSRRVPR
jgi:NADPH:quinone reductase-like Zn-dependent oxidoreductase